MPCPQGEPPGKGTSFFLSHDQSHSQINEVSWKDVTNALSLANMVLGLFSIIFSFSRKRHYASWMLLVSFLLDMAVRAMTSHINICSKWGVPSTYKGLPCPYASCILASTSLLTKGNRFILCCMASLMILFMMDQSYYPYDKILESENWKKLVYMGGDICYNSPERRSWEYRLQQAVVMERRWQETSSVYVFEHHLPETGTQASLHRQRPKLDSKEFLGSYCW
ncbi:transmembrane protein 269 isoform X7 [Macaca nemestrina]|uniref:transmembrane protein 269 isoform X7 n=1 Tax=Macaca nemestrina TaxID=9545 RepID=UPI0039B85E87